MTMEDFERFLAYSLRHNRPVKVLTERDGALRYVTLTVIALEGEDVIYITARRKTPAKLRLKDILAASYARGDDGDTLRNEEREKEE